MCKLTRMVVNTEWDQKVWEEAWEPRAEETVAEDSLRETGKTKRGKSEERAAKRVRREEQGIVWGEEAQEKDNNMMEFLMGQSEVPVNHNAQARLKFYSGIEWVMRELIKECTHKAVELATLTEGAATWDQWESTEGVTRESVRTDKEERLLWRMLEEMDNEDAKVEKKVKLKKEKKVILARKKMGADKCQPSILEKVIQSRRKDTPSHRPPPMEKLKTYKLLGAGSRPVVSTPPSNPPTNSPPTSLGNIVEEDVTKYEVPQVCDHDERCGELKVQGDAQHGVQDEVRDDVHVQTSDVLKNVDMYGIDAKPKENPSVAELSLVWSEKQGVASPEGSANKLQTPGNMEMGCQRRAAEPVDTRTVQFKCTRPAVCGVDKECYSTLCTVSSANTKNGPASAREGSESFRNDKEYLGCKAKTTFTVTTVSRGKFTLADAKGSPASRGKLESKNKHTAAKKSFVKKNEKHTHNFGGARDMANFISTPTKRKDGGRSGAVQSLLCIFENTIITKPSNEYYGESPAKRRRCGHQGS